MDGNSTASFGRPNAEAVERIGRRLIDSGLGQGDSLLTPGRPVWTNANLAELQRDYVDRPDEGSGTFFDKLAVQLAGSSDGAVQLFAELFIVNVLPIGDLGGPLKITHLRRILDLADAPIGVPEDVEETLLGGGVYGGGQAFNNYRWKQLAYLVRFAEHFVQLPAAEQAAALGDPLEFRRQAEAVETGQAAQRQSLLYLAFPKFFLPIVSRNHRLRIRDTFAPEYLQGGTTDDVDQDLHDLYEAMAAEHSDPVDYYRSPWKERWQEPKPTKKQKVADAIAAQDGSEAGQQRNERRATGLSLPDADEALAAQLHLPQEWLQECIELLRDRPQLIFYGPPGTGKTYVAQALAEHIAGADHVSLVQFHPAYSYEDFFEGYRPVQQDGGQVNFTLKPGPLRRLVTRARQDPDRPHVLIIDEINRGNLAKIFGELYFLLEYRDRAIDLLYGSGAEPFSLPGNIIVLGTMNTADRSIALVDAAMRRRFHFMALHPAADPVDGLLRRWLQAQGLPTVNADLLDALNTRIDDEDFQIGPSYLMRPMATDPGGLARIWRHDILPLLEEFHYGDRSLDVTARYGLEAMHRAVASGVDARGPDAEDTAPDDDDEDAAAAVGDEA